MQNLGIWWLVGTGVRIRRRKCHIWKRDGTTTMTNGSLLLNVPTVKHVQSKNSLDQNL